MAYAASCRIAEFGTDFAKWTDRKEDSKMNRKDEKEV